MRLWKKIPNCRRCVFFDCPQTRIASRQNAFVYDGCASGRLYYFGARYYDPRTSVWQSADPILGKYLPSGGNASNLPGMGGIYNSFNLGLYTYGHLNPVRYSDPDGNVVIGIPFTDKYFVLQQKPGGGIAAEITTRAEGRHIDPAPNGLFSSQQISFKNDNPRGASPDQKVSFDAADMVEGAIRNTGQTININSTTGGVHSSPNSNHYRHKAVDIDHIGGVGVGVASNRGEVRKLQQAFDKDPNNRENFGPAFKHKTEESGTRHNNWPAAEHGGHLHEASQH